MFKKILVLGFCFYVSVLAQSIGPRATVPQLNYDVTQVAKGTSINHTFMIYNGGDETLYLSDITSSCKCITSSLNKNKLIPTDSAKLDVSFSNTGSSSGGNEYVSIKTNDPSNPDIRIFLTRVTPGTAPTLSELPKDSTTKTSSSSSVSTSPGPSIYFPETEYDFGKMKDGTVAEHIFKFYNKGNSTLKIKDITTSCGCTAAVVKDKNIEPGKEGEIRVQFDSSGKMGKLSRRITIISNDVKHPYKLLVIYAEVFREDK